MGPHRRCPPGGLRSGTRAMARQEGSGQVPGGGPAGVPARMASQVRHQGDGPTGGLRSHRFSGGPAGVPARMASQVRYQGDGPSGGSGLTGSRWGSRGGVPAVSACARVQISAPTRAPQPLGSSSRASSLAHRACRSRFLLLISSRFRFILAHRSLSARRRALHRSHIARAEALNKGGL